MISLRFIHTADWHADSDPKKSAKLEASLKQLVEYCKNVKVNAIIHAGDIWDKKQSYSESSGVPLVIDYLKQLSRLVDFIFITKGNNSHDEPGSIQLLDGLEDNIFADEHPQCLAVCGSNGLDLLHGDGPDELDEPVDYIISLVPYPTKASFISEDSIDNNNAEFIQKFEQVFELLGDITEDYKCPKLLAFHGNVVGSRLSSGQTLVSQDIMVAPATLQKAKHDYYALGHIHLDQEVAPWMAYSGSIYNKNWGETEQKSFRVIEYSFNTLKEDGDFTVERVMLTAARPMISIEAEFDGADFITENDLLENIKVIDAEYRLRIKVPENERNLITEASIEELKDHFGGDTKIEINITPSQRDSRSEQIMSCKTLMDEVIEYAAVVKETFSNGVIEKVQELQESEVNAL
jgi:DNA repair exonuclease SbcCD nuclease subunit